MTKLIYTLPLLAMPALGFAQTAQEEADKGYLIELIEDNLSGVSRQVSITGFRGALSSEASLDRLTIADEEGIWLTLEDAVLDWNRGALLRGRIEVNELSAAKITVARAPINDGSGGGGSRERTAESQPFSLPDLPVSIELGQLQIDTIALGESFLGEPVQISLTGNAALASGEGSANVTATRLDGPTGQFIIDGSYSNTTTILDLALDVKEAQDGLAARLLDIPDRPALALTIAGDGPIETFGADLTLATDGQDRVTGTFSRAPQNGTEGFALDIRGDLTPLLDPAYHDFFGAEVALVAEGRQRGDGGYDLPTLDLTARRLRLTGDAVLGAEGWPERIDVVGAIGDPSGDPVLLPLRGPKTRVDAMDLNIAYDQAVSEDWTADFRIKGYDRTGVSIAAIDLTGGGLLRPGEGAAVGEVTANMRFAATGLELDDTGLADALGDTVTGTFQASRVEDAPILLDAFTLRGPGLEVDAAGQIDTGGEGIAIDSTIALTVAALDRFSTLAGRPLGGSAKTEIVSQINPVLDQYDITVTGDTTDLRADIAQVDPLLRGDGTIDIRFVRDTDGTRLERFNITTAEATITADADLTSDGSEARFDAAIRDVAMMEPTLNGPATLKGTATQFDTGVVTFDVSGSGPEVDLTADGTATPQDIGYAVSADVTAKIADLSAYATATGRPLDGAATATLNGTIDTGSLLFDGDLSAVTTDLAIGIPQVDRLLTGTGTIVADLRRDSATGFASDSLTLRLPALRLDAGGAFDSEGPIDARFDGRLSDAGLVLEGLSGPVTATGTVKRGADGNAAVDVTAAAQGGSADVDVTVAPVTNALSGTIAAQVADLAPFAGLIGRPVSGGVDAKVNGDLIPDLSSFDLTVDVTTQDLTTGIAQVDPLLAGTGTVTGSAMRGAEGITVPGLALRTPQVSLDAVLSTDNAGAGRGNYSALLRDVSLIAPGLNGPATAEGTAAQGTDGTWAIQSNLTAPEATASADLRIAPDTQELSGTVQARLNALSAYAPLIGQPVSGGVNATVTGRVLPDLSQFSANVDLETRDIGIGNDIADLLLRGLGSAQLSATRTSDGIKIDDLTARTNNLSLSGTLDTTNAGDSAGRFTARLRDIGILTDQLSGPVTADGTASLAADGRMGLDITGAGPGGIAMTAGGTVARDGRLDLDVDGRLPLGVANTALAPRRLSGTATVSLGVNGPPALSSVTGDIRIVEGRLADPTLTQALEDIGGTITLGNARAVVEITGRIPAGGTIAVTGPVGLEGARNADLALALRDVVLRDPALYETELDGTITVAGPLAGGARVTGRINVGTTEVQVPSSGVGSLGDLPSVVHIGQGGQVQQTLDRAGVRPRQQAASAPSRRAGGPVFPLNIIVDAPSRLFIRGRGLDAELGGRLRITGTSANVVPQGEFALIRGRLNILQQRFELTEGEATLQGDFSPYLRLVAETEARTGTIVRVIIAGTPDAPEVTFTSVPDLPQDEVLAQLLFGRNLSEISPFQAVQLAAAVGTLAGTGGAGVIDGFRQELGLDDFDVTTDEEGNAAVRAGAYLSENVYTDVTVNSEGDTEINLNLDITSEVTAKGSVDQDGETTLGIFFERDY